MKTEKFSTVWHNDCLILGSWGDSKAEQWAFFEEKVKGICLFLVTMAEKRTFF